MLNYLFYTYFHKYVVHKVHPYFALLKFEPKRVFEVVYKYMLNVYLRCNCVLSGIVLSYYTEQYCRDKV